METRLAVSRLKHLQHRSSSSSSSLENPKSLRGLWVFLFAYSGVNRHPSLHPKDALAASAAYPMQPILYILALLHILPEYEDKLLTLFFFEDGIAIVVVRLQPYQA